MLKPLFKSLFLIAAIGLSVYSFTFPNSFVWDDKHLITENRFIKNFSNWPLSFTRPLFHNDGEKSKFYRPLQEISYACDYRLWGLNPFGFHLTNTFFHISSALLFSIILFQIFKNPFISFWGGAFFVVHPVQVEAAAYISGRADPMSLFFILLSLSCYIQAVGKKRILLIPALFSYFLALFSKESGLIFPFVILAYNFVFLKKHSLRNKLNLFLSFIPVTMFYLFIRFHFTGLTALKFYHWRQPWSIRLLTQLKVIVRYLFLLFFPHNLHMERFVPWSRSILDFTVISSLIFLTLLVYICIKLSKKERALSFFFLFFIITLFPFLNIFPLNAQLAEHWLYMPSIGFLAVSAWGAFRVKEWLERLKIQKLGKNFLPLLLTLLLLIYSRTAIKQIKTWENYLTFSQYTASKAPYSNRMLLCLASAYLKAKNYTQAAGFLKTAVKTSPENIKARNILASTLIKLGKLKEAKNQLELILNKDPSYLKAYLNLAELYQKMEDKTKVIETYKKMLEIDPGFTLSYYKLGNLYYQDNRIKEAITLFKKGLTFDHEFIELHNNLGICYAELERYNEAEAEWRKALNLDPYYQEAKYNLGLLKKPAVPDDTD